MNELAFERGQTFNFIRHLPRVQKSIATNEDVAVFFDGSVMFVVVHRHMPLAVFFVPDAGPNCMVEFHVLSEIEALNHTCQVAEDVV